METPCINVSLPREMLAGLSKEVASRKRSGFITEAVRRFLKEPREKNLLPSTGRPLKLHYDVEW